SGEPPGRAPHRRRAAILGATRLCKTRLRSLFDAPLLASEQPPAAGLADPGIGHAQNRTAAQVCRQGDGGGVAVGVDLHVAKLERVERRVAQRRSDEGGVVERLYGSEGEVVLQQ